MRHGSFRTAAKEAGVSETTMWRYRQMPHFQRRLKEIKELIEEDTISAIRFASVRAAGRLLQLMDSEGVQDAIRYASAKTVLDFHFRNQEIEAIRTDVEELRAWVQMKRM